jgi:hypothetical protein
VNLPPLLTSCGMGLAWASANDAVAARINDRRTILCGRMDLLNVQSSEFNLRHVRDARRSR